ncbi:MAG: hypothetical protein CM1200mP3_08640 [Chloroflexota bacterium]|nr:MAG: hypothetical protein CM1200mP3_08640 [Chloroflexota bacterium]
MGTESFWRSCGVSGIRNHLEPNFLDSLERAHISWNEEGFKVIWLEIPSAVYSVLPMACDNGFIFHHASSEYVMLTLVWEKRSPCPPYATH